MSKKVITIELDSDTASAVIFEGNNRDECEWYRGLYSPQDLVDVFDVYVNHHIKYTDIRGILL